MRNNENSLSIVVPAYDEEGAIAQVIEEIQTICKDLTYEIIVVDDASRDKTADIAERSNARVIRHQSNCGYGSAIKSGVRAAQYNIICITDADGTYPNDRIIDLVEHLNRNGVAMVIGARPWKKIQFSRKYTKLFIKMLSEYLVEQKIPDLNSGLRVFKKEIFNQYIYLLPNGFSLTSTLTLLFLSSGHRVHFEPIDYLERVGKSKIRPINDTLNFLQLIFRTALYFNPLRVFLPIALFLFIPGLVIMVVQGILLKNISTISVLLILSGIQILAIGLLADLINRKVR